MSEAGLLQVYISDLSSVKRTVTQMRDYIHTQHEALKRAESLMTTVDASRAADGIPCPSCGCLTYWGHLFGCDYITTLATVQEALKPPHSGD